MCTYLLKRGSVYYFRRAVPDDLVGQFLNSNGKPLTEWTYSLGVKDRGEAKRLIPARAMATDKIISEARARPSTKSATAARQSPAELGNDSLRQLLDRQEQHSREGAEYFYQQDVEEELRRDSDPLYKAQAELRDEVTLKVRELRETREKPRHEPDYLPERSPITPCFPRTCAEADMGVIANDIQPATMSILFEVILGLLTKGR